MNSVQNSLLTAIVDLLSSKHTRKQTTEILGELEQTLLTKCVNIVSSSQTPGCC
jgi:hypothetical protein